jgi:hypothetical protein
MLVTVNRGPKAKPLQVYRLPNHVGLKVDTQRLNPTKELPGQPANEPLGQDRWLIGPSLKADLVLTTFYREGAPVSRIKFPSNLTLIIERDTLFMSNMDVLVPVAVMSGTGWRLSESDEELEYFVITEALDTDNTLNGED